MAEVVRPSPARAEPHDETTWLPLPGLEGLPEIHDLVATPPPDDTGSRDIPVGLPSPARAEPHDETTWLPLPEVEDLPQIDELLTAPPADDTAARDIPVGTPSPARAEPHDETTWLPLPEVEDLPEITELVDPDRATATGPPAAPRPRRRALTGVSPRRVVAAVVAASLVIVGFYTVPQIFSSGDHVQVRVDGRLLSAVSGQNTVGALLREQHVSVRREDIVDPPRTDTLSDGMTIRVHRAFPVTVDLDGLMRVLYTARSLPHAFVASLKLPSSVAILNPPARLSSGVTLQLRTVRVGTLSLDGQGVNYKLPVRTVRELLDYYKVVLGPSDYTSPPIDTVIPLDNPFVQVIRVGVSLTSNLQPYDLPLQTLPDPNLPVGQTREQAAVHGILKVTYEVTSNNGSAVGQTPVSQVPVVTAQAPVHYYGTKADPRWDAIANCETGGNWAMQGPLYSGGTGIYNGTWNAFGGQQFGANAGQATREQQIIVAERIRARYGFSAWGCGKKLGYG